MTTKETILAALTAAKGTAVSGAQYETMITNNDKNFASWYASAEENIKNKISAYLEIFSK